MKAMMARRAVLIMTIRKMILKMIMIMMMKLPDGPGGLPGLRVVAGDGQTNFLTNLKPSIGLEILQLNREKIF